MDQDVGIKIRGVLFDYGMVLSGPPDPTARRRMERLLGVDEQHLQRAYWKHRDAYDRGALDGKAYWRRVADDVQRDVDGEGIDGLLRADVALWTVPNGPMIAWAGRLQRAGVRTGILSNLGDAMEVGIRARFEWLGGFAHSTFSHRVGIAKPDAGIYLLASEGLEVPVTEILFVDDREENVVAARAVGMVAVQYTRHDAFEERIKSMRLDSLLLPTRP